MPAQNNSKNLGSRERLLRAASTLFSVKGYHGTSTRDLAKRAHVNETTIFRLFKSKRELYASVLERNMGTNDFDWLQPVLQSSGDDETVLTLLANRLQNLLRPEFLRLIFFAALEKPELLRKHFHSRSLRFYEALGRHIQSRIDSGVLKNLNPHLMGRAFVAMITCHEAFVELIGAPELADGSTPDWPKIYTDIWLHGALSESARGRASRPEFPDMEGLGARKRIPERSLPPVEKNPPKTAKAKTGVSEEEVPTKYEAV
jgi:TetR/AcrR family transcriptional regulator